MKSQTPFPVAQYLIPSVLIISGILIALCAVIAEMAFPGQVGTDISRNDRHPQLHVIRSRLHTVLVVWMLYSQIPRIDLWMSVTRTEAVILGWEAP
jgi:hypothetical protein